jgi:enamine deaminase RidA (YjgF/YER057c/UK114 family)
MALDYLTPNGLFKPVVYTQVVAPTARRLVFISGQV